MNNITELVFILDKSGSMAGRESDTTGGVNAILEEQRNSGKQVYVNTVLFADEMETLHDRVLISDVKNLTAKDYRVGGCTALIDAIGSTVDHIENIHKYIRSEDIPDKTLFVITTDGLENASHRYNSKQVKKMISRQKEKGWEFLFLGANIDAVETAEVFGIEEDRAINYVNDHKGINAMFKAAGNFVNAMFCEPEACLEDNAWREEVDEDYAQRGRNNQ